MGGPVLWPRVVLRSSEQTLYFNCPYQVEAQEAPMLLRSVDLLRAQVHEGDIVLAATDGVFDNLFDWQVQTVVARHLQRVIEDSAGAIDDLASAVAEEAHSVGQREDDPSFITPFGLAARREGLKFEGGKMDDICGCGRRGAPGRGVAADIADQLLKVRFGPELVD